MSLVVKGSKPYMKLTDTDTAHDVNLQNDGTELTVDNDILISKATPATKLNDTASGNTATISYDGSKVALDTEFDATKLVDTTINASLDSHGSRHDRGGADAFDWSALSKWLNKSASGVSIGVSGSPASILKVSVETNYYNLLLKMIKVTPSGLATGESVTYHVIFYFSDGTNAEVATKSGVTAATTLTDADIDWSLIPDGVRVTDIEVTAESSATSTSATSDATIVAMEF